MPLSSIFRRRDVWKLPGLKQIQTMVGKELGHFRGKFRTIEEARASMPPSRRSTWDNPVLVDNGIASFSTVHVFDWPLLFFLQKLLLQNELRVVTDFGGHIGVKFYAFREMLDLPPDFQWQVVEVPALIEAGRNRVPPDVHALKFYEHLEETQPCEVLICSGVLQYADKTLEEILTRLPNKPRVVLVNKVAVSSKQAFFTVESYIKALPYRVLGPHDLEELRLRHGYSLSGSWTIPHRDIIVLASNGNEHIQMVGEAWTL